MKAKTVDLKSKTLNLSIGDIVSIGIFLISVGITIGGIWKTIQKIDSLEFKSEKIESNLNNLDKRLIKNEVLIQNIKK